MSRSAALQMEIASNMIQIASMVADARAEVDRLRRVEAEHGALLRRNAELEAEVARLRDLLLRMPLGEQ